MRWLLVLALVFAFPVASFAGEGDIVVFKTREASGTDAEKPQSSITVKGDPNHVRIEDPDGKTTMIATRLPDGGIEVFVMDDAEKTKYKLDRAMIEQIKKFRTGAGVPGGKKPGGGMGGMGPADQAQIVEKLKAAIAKLKAQRDALPPQQANLKPHFDQQIAVLEEQLRKFGGAAEAEKKEGTPSSSPLHPSAKNKRVIKKAGTEKWRSHEAVKWEVTKGGKVVEVILTVPCKALGIKGEFLGVMRDVGKLFSEMSEAAGGMSSDSGADFDMFTKIPAGHFPVVTRDFEDGKVTEETSVESAKRGELGDKAFTPRADYKTKDMMGG